MLNLLQTKYDTVKVAHGVIWALSVLPDGRLAGRPVAETPVSDGWIRIAPPGFAYSRALEDARDLHVADIRANRLTDELETRIKAMALVNGNVLLGWGNLTIGDEPLAFTKEKAIELLASPAWTTLREIVQSCADNRRALLEEQEAKDLGNSLAGSTGQ
jgi:hypothetical protein